MISFFNENSDRIQSFDQLNRSNIVSREKLFKTGPRARKKERTILFLFTALLFSICKQIYLLIKVKMNRKTTWVTIINYVQSCQSGFLVKTKSKVRLSEDISIHRFFSFFLLSTFFSGER